MSNKSDTAQTRNFLDGMKSGEPCHLVAIGLDGKIEARTFESGGAAEAWIAERQGRANLYYHVNRLKEGVAHVKAKRTDVSEATFLHVDIDSVDGLAALESFPIRPSTIVMSGGGYHAYWKLSKPTTDLDRVERINAAIAELVGGDHCHNVDRILRLPGTINIPSEKKRAAGRTDCLAYIVEADWTREYDLSKFDPFDPGPAAPAIALSVPANVEAVDLDALPPTVLPGTRRLLEIGDDPERPRGTPGARYPSRSEAVFHAACDLARAGCSPEVIAGVLLNPALGISESVIERKNAQAYALRQGRAAHATVGDYWPDTERSGKPKGTMRNAAVALRRLGLTFSQDLFRHRKMVSGISLEQHQGELSDDMCTLLRGMIIERFGFDPRAENVVDAINMLCLENSYHPVRQMLDDLVWDGKPRLDNWLTKYLGAEDTPLNRAIGRILLIAAIRRVRQPGVKFDQIVVLEGAQGSGKSTTVKILAGEEFHADQDILNLDTKAQIEVLDGVWFYELGEVEGMNRAEVNKIKAFASRQADRARMAYGRFAVTRPRQAVFIGTTNDNKYLRDQTGNRRFWPVETGKIDLEGLKRDRDQLLAEAAHYENAGESIGLPEELWQAAAKEQAARLEDDPWIDLIEAANPQVAGDTLRHHTGDLLSQVLAIPAERQTQAHTKRLAVLMQKLGWKPAKFRVGPQTIRGYHKPKPRDYELPRPERRTPI